MRALIVEDDIELNAALERRLRASCFAVGTSADIPEAELVIAVNRYDCLVLDRTVPTANTIEMVRELRDRGATVPSGLEQQLGSPRQHAFDLAEVRERLE